MSEETNVLGGFGEHGPDLDGQSDTVKERFGEATEIAEMNGEKMYFLDGMEGAMIGTVENAAGVRVAVYERNLCIQCIMESFGDDWMDEPAYGYTDEQKADKAFMEEELRSMADEYFEYNTLGALPCLYEKAPVIITGFGADTGKWTRENWG